MSMDAPFDEPGLNLDGMTNSQQPPLFFDLMESLPGITTAALWNSRRYSNTLMRGGWADASMRTNPGRVGSALNRREARRARRLSATIDNVVQPSSGSYLGSGNFNTKKAKARAARRAAKGPAAFVRPSLANHMPLTPSGAVKKLGRFSSITALTGDRMTGYYTPLQVVSSFTDMLSNKAGFRARFNLQEGEKAWSGGVLGRMNSMNQLYDLDAKIAKAGASTKRGQALAAKRQQMVTNIANVQGVSTKGFGAGNLFDARSQRFRDPVTGRFISQTQAVASQKAIAMRSIADDPLKALSSTMTTGVLSNRITKYYAGALDPRLMTEGQQAVAKRVISKQKRGGHTGRAAAYSQFLDDFGSTGKYAGNALSRFRGGMEMIKMSGRYVASGGSKATASAFSRMGATRMFGAALAPINVLATTALVYDLAKGAGKLVMRGANFAKDAIKSAQGTINKPIFGTGFRDNEVAATSRSRGVMAIQNSRLNARSLLGSEAAMMAAHFG